MDMRPAHFRAREHERESELRTTKRKSGQRRERDARRSAPNHELQIASHELQFHESPLANQHSEIAIF
jgi:hypothetical protein